MKVVLYSRVSRHDAEQDPETQLVKLREYAQRHGWTIVGEYKDFASGADPSRPDLDKMLAQARAKHFDAIVAVRIDRIGRSVANLQTIARELQHYGVELICSDQDIDTTTPSGKLIFTVLSAVSEFELELIRDRTLDGLAKARLKGKRLGRPRLPISTDEIKRLRQEGLTLKQIAERVGMSYVGVKKRLRVDRDTKGVQEAR